VNYAPINGLRLLAVESCILCAAFVLVFVVFDFVRPSATRPRIFDAILARNYRGVLLVVAAALSVRALLLPMVGIPQPRINDEYSNLLMADTFSRYRLANPPPRSGNISKPFT
jgi:hypothetical protein